MRCAPTLWDGLKSRVPQRRGGISAKPRTIWRAALGRTCLPRAPDVCRVRANPQNRPSSRGVRRRDLRPGHGVPRQAEQRGAGSARNHRFKLAAGDPAACENRQQPRLTTTGDGLKRAGDRRRPQVTQRFASIHSTPADQNGRRPQGVADVPLAEGNRRPRQRQARDQCLSGTLPSKQ